MTRTRFVTAGLFLVVLVAVGAHAAQAALLDVNMGNYYYDDATPGDGKVEATVGDQLRFIAQDSGAGTPHTVEVDELNIHSGPLGTGKTFTTPPLQRAGTFKLYCKPHERKGHVASLVVYNADGSLPPPETATTTTAPATTTTAPTSTTAPPSSPTTTSASTATTAQATRATPAATSSTTTVKGATTTTTAAAANGADTAVTTPNADAPGDAASSESEVASAPSDTVPSGTGEATEAELDAAPVKPGSLREALGRRPAAKGPWTRSVRMALAALAPMILLAGVAVSRIDRDVPPDARRVPSDET